MGAPMDGDGGEQLCDVYDTEDLAAAGVTLAPGWDVEICPPTRNDRYAHITIHTLGIAPEAYDTPTAALWGTDERGLFPGGLAADVPGPHTPESWAVHLVASLAVAGLHEALEWVKVDGRRLADPHPQDEEEMWEWVIRQATCLVRDYMNRYPAEGER